MITSARVSAPASLLISCEQFTLNVTEVLDPIVSLKLTNIVKQLVDVAYIMGHEDGKHGTSSDSRF